MKLSIDRPIALDVNETLRYLKSKGDPSLLDDIDAVWDQLSPKLQPAAAAVCCDLIRRDGALFCGDLQLPGKAIAAHFEGCDRCAVLGVTVGFEVDRFISTLGHIDPYRALLADACATAAVEELADMMTVAAREQFCPGARITFRFSPGYGDLPISMQPKLLEFIDARRMLGLTVSRSMLLSPIKSVTAFIGLSSGDGRCDNIVRHDCSRCFMKGRCQFASK